MNQVRTYFHLQLKNVFQRIPKMIAGIIALAIFISAITFCGTKLLYSRAAATQVSIALVVEDDSPLMNLGLNYLNSSESVHSFCQLVPCEKEHAFQMLENQQVIAVVYFPENFSKDIANGTNTPATITFANESGIEQLLFNELVTAASHILGYAQASIYAADDLYENYDFQKKKKEIFNYLNQNTLKTAMVRSSLFQVKTISSTNHLSTKEFYIISCLTLLIFLSAMSLSGFAQPESGGIAGLLSRHGVGFCSRTLCKGGALFLFYLIICLLMFLGCVIAGLLPWKCLLALPITSLITASWTLFWYHLARQETAGTLLLFLFTLLFALCSGCLIPSSFLPRSIAAFGSMLPLWYMHRLLSKTIIDSVYFRDTLPLLLYSIIFLTVAGFCATHTERGELL